MSNSPLVTYTKLSPNHSGPRNHEIDTITIHCTAGQGTAKSILNLSHFVYSGLKNSCSCNYAIGKDGSIGLCVEEANRSWCSSNIANDNRAVTIEVSSDAAHPYAVTDKAYAALLDLVTDICRRNGIKRLLWKGDKSLIGQVDKQNMTVHRWFSAKACPGDYLYSRHGAIAEEVNRRLGVSTGTTTQAPVEANMGTAVGKTLPYSVRVSVTTLRIRKGPGTNYANLGYIKPGAYTIIEEANGAGASKWGCLKSRAGWISLDYVKRI